LISGFEDKQQLKQNILAFYREYKKGSLVSESRNIERYSRKALTGRLSEVPDALAGR